MKKAYAGILVVGVLALASGTLCGMIVMGGPGFRGQWAGPNGNQVDEEPEVLKTATQPADTRPAHDDAYWNDMLSKLGDADPAVRAEGQRALEQVGAIEYERLETTHKATTDEEVRSRLSDRIEELNEANALNPRPLTISVKDANLPEVVTQFRKATGFSIETWGGENSGKGPYTLDAKDEPFWQIIAKLSAQRGIQVETYSGIRMYQNDGGAFRRYVPAAAGFGVFPGNLQWYKTVNLQMDPGTGDQTPQLTFNFTMVADPRIRILRYYPPTIYEAIDDKGENLCQQWANMDEHQRWKMMQPQWGNNPANCVFQQSLSFKTPEKRGGKLVNVKGEARFIVIVSQQKTEINPEENVGQPFEIWNRRITISQWQVQNNSVNFQIQCQPIDNQPMEWGGQMEFVDANGKVIYTSGLDGGTGGGVGGDFKKPLKIRVTVPLKTKNVLVPFELHNLQLP